MRISIETRGVEEAQEFFRNAAINLAGGPKTVSVAMAGERNQTIASVQADADRNPFYVTKPESNIMQGLIAGGLSQTLATKRRGAMRRALQDVGDVLVNAFRDHIHGRKSGGRPPVRVPASPHQTAPLTKRYAEWKRKKFGKSVPELIASGEFIQSMKVEVK